MREMRERVDILAGKIENMPPTNVTYIQNNSLHINGLGNEDLSRVTKEFLTECLKQLPNGNKGILDLVKLIHHDTEGNMNVKCVEGDKNDLVMSYYDENKKQWMVDAKSKVIDSMMRRPRSMLKDHFRCKTTNFERELTSALYNFVDHWFKSTRNKRNHVYEDSARRLHTMVKRWGEAIMNDILENDEDEDATGGDIIEERDDDDDDDENEEEEEEEEEEKEPIETTGGGGKLEGCATTSLSA